MEVQIRHSILSHSAYSLCRWSFLSVAFVTAGILIWHNRRSTGVANTINNGSRLWPLQPWQWVSDSEPACLTPGSWKRKQLVKTEPRQMCSAKYLLSKKVYFRSWAIPTCHRYCLSSELTRTHAPSAVISSLETIALWHAVIWLLSYPCFLCSWPLGFLLPHLHSFGPVCLFWLPPFCTSPHIHPALVQGLHTHLWGQRQSREKGTLI